MLLCVYRNNLDFDEKWHFFVLQSRILEDASIMCNSWSPRHNVSTEFFFLYFYHNFNPLLTGSSGSKIFNSLL